MDAGQVAQGLGLGAFGAAFLGLARWYVHDDARMRHLTESRWRLDRYQRKIRTSEMSQQDWYASYASSQRRLVKWFFTPFVVLWLALCVGVTVHGLMAP